MPPTCASGVTYSDPVAIPRTTFHHQVLKFSDGHGFWNVREMYYAALCTEGITSRRSADIATSTVFIDALKSRWNVSRWLSPTCTATVLPPFPGKNSKAIRDLFFSLCVL